MKTLYEKKLTFTDKIKLSFVYRKIKHLSECLEEIAFDKYIWWLRYYWSNKKFENTVKNENADFAQLRKASNDIEASDNALHYGKPLTPYQKERIIQLEKGGVSKADIKLIVSSQYINKDGSIRERSLRDRVALIASWIQLLLITISVLWIGLVIWLSPVSLVWKVLLSLVYFSFFIFAGHIYRTLGLRSWKVYNIVQDILDN